MVTGTNIAYLVIHFDTQVQMRRKESGYLERVSVIDRLGASGLAEYPVAVATPLGVYVERVAFEPKLILWGSIADMHFSGDLLQTWGVQPPSSVAGVGVGAGVGNGSESPSGAVGVGTRNAGGASAPHANQAKGK